MDFGFTKDILTAIGATLGAFAFFQNFLKPMSSANKDRMRYIEENIVNDGNLESLAYYGWYRQAISHSDLDRLSRLVDRYEKTSPEVAFKTLFGDPYSRRLRKISKAYHAYRELVQAPMWSYVAGDDRDLIRLEKDRFYKHALSEDSQIQATKDYQAHLESVHDHMAEIQAIFRELRALAMRDDYEYLLPWKWRVKVKPVSY